MNRSGIWLRLRALFFRRRVEREMKEELDFHLEMQTRKNRALGASGGEAKRQALMKFGSVARFEEECRDERRIHVIDSHRSALHGPLGRGGRRGSESARGDRSGPRGAAGGHDFGGSPPP